MRRRGRRSVVTDQKRGRGLWKTREMTACGKCIAKMTVFFNEMKPSEAVTCFCTRALLRYGLNQSPHFALCTGICRTVPEFEVNSGTACTCILQSS